MKLKRKSILITALFSFGLIAGTVAVVQTKSNSPVVSYAADDTFQDDQSELVFKITSIGKVNTAKTKSPITVKDVLPEDFVVVDDDFPENCWTNENGVMIVNLSNITLYLHDEDSVDYMYPNDINSFVTQEGNNYLLTCDDGTVTTFVMESGELAKIVVANNPDYPQANGEYVKPLSDSKTDFIIEFGTKSVDYSVAAGVGVINMSKDNYEMVVELYVDSSATEIPAGVYTLSDTGEESTALISEGIVNGAPKKSYIALRNNQDEITDCWLMNEGTITVSYEGSEMIVEVSAYNTNGNSIETSGSYLYTIDDLMIANSSFPKSFTDAFSNESWLNEKGVKMCYFPTQKLFKFGAMSYYASDTYGLTRVSANQYKFENTGKTIEFNLTDGVLSSVVVSNYSKTLDGTYSAHSAHAIAETFAKVEPTCTESGREVYYSCVCGKYFADANLTEEIADLTAWLAADGEGYIGPLGHDFSGTVTYLWSEDKTTCTATVQCSHGDCEETLTETAESEYIRDFEATCSTNAKGHYEATFKNELFKKQTTLIEDEPNTATGHDFTGTVSYSWNEDHSKCTATVICSHDGCEETLTETAESEYIRDFEATCSANAKGHYEATFKNELFKKQTTLMEDEPNTAKGHDYVITYTWNEDNTACVAKAECSKGDASITNEATITEEDGYIVATFTDEIFETQRVKLPEPEPEPQPTPEEPKGLSGGAIAGIAVGSVLGVCLISYVTMFFVWKKKQKALKFLTPSFKWINTKIFKK